MEKFWPTIFLVNLATLEVFPKTNESDSDTRSLQNLYFSFLSHPEVDLQMCFRLVFYITQVNLSSVYEFIVDRNTRAQFWYLQI